MEKNTEFITVTELSKLVGCSVQTIGSYYKFKKENPDNELAKLLPDFVRIGRRNTRYWKREDAEAIKEFRKRYPQKRKAADEHGESEPKSALVEGVTLDQFRKARNQELRKVKDFFAHAKDGPLDEAAKRIVLKFIKIATYNIQCELFGDPDADIIKLRDDGKENIIILEDGKGNVHFIRKSDFLGEDEEAS